MARQDFGKRDRDDDRSGRSGEQWNHEDDDMGEGRGSRRGREFQQHDQEFGHERDREHREGFQDWRRQEQEGRMHGGRGSGDSWGERRPGGGYQDTEDRERSGYGDRGWENSGMGEPRTFGEGSYRRSGGMSGGTFGSGSGMYGRTGQQGGQGMYGGSGMGQNFGESGTYGGSSMYGGGYGAGMMGEQSDWQRGESGGARQRGRFFGRGPKGYRRADDRIREDINERLFRHNDVDASEVEIEVREGTVTLSGTVDSRETRRMAEDCVWDVTGVQHVTNQIRVDPNRQQARGGNGGEWAQRGTMESGSQHTGSQQTGRGGQGTQGGQTSQPGSQTRGKKNR